MCLKNASKMQWKNNPNCFECWRSTDAKSNAVPCPLWTISFNLYSIVYKMKRHWTRREYYATLDAATLNVALHLGAKYIYGMLKCMFIGSDLPLLAKDISRQMAKFAEQRSPPPNGSSFGHWTPQCWQKDSSRTRFLSARICARPKMEIPLWSRSRACVIGPRTVRSDKKNEDFALTVRQPQLWITKITAVFTRRESFQFEEM